MLKNYFITAIRNLRKNKAHSFINIAGLSVGMAVAMFIGLWVWDELSFDKYHQNYDSIAQVMQSETYNGIIGTQEALPLPIDAEMRKSYGSDFKHIVMSSWTENHILSIGDKKIAFFGNFIGAEGPEMFTIKMLKGNRGALKDASAILLSQTAATALFGNAEPTGQLVKLDNGASFKVAGVYEDLPLNTTLHDLAFLAPWEYYRTSQDWIRDAVNDWGDNSFQMYVQLADNADMAKVSAKIKDIKLNKIDKQDAAYKPTIFLQPMAKWHLYSEFKNGVNTGGAIQNVWLFGMIGAFVLLLACVNFMNLSTARSEKRAKEVGIRKAVGSLSSQLISQFFCESMLTAVLAFVFSLALVWLVLPFFNTAADKQMYLPLNNVFFWIMSMAFTLFTGLVAGSYPALYLSSFNPVKVLKGAFKAGRFAAMPRKALVVLQFTVSVVLIIGTIIVFKQIQFAKNRPIGYNRNGLVTIKLATDDLHAHFEAVRQELQKSGAIIEAAESSSPLTAIHNNRGDVSWTGKDPAMTTDFANIRVTTGYGKTVGWQFAEGRDFSPQLPTDSQAVVLNEAAVKYMGLKKPLGQTIKVGKRNLAIIGIVKNMVMQSPYDPAKQTLFYITSADFEDVILRINPNISTHEALEKIEAVCKTYSPSVPFSYKFADDEYAKKFSNEERTGGLASVFAVLAVFISCLGLFGMATFMAEQRIKEIGVRKVLGASVLNLWALLSKDFVVLVVISLFIAIPLAYYFMGNWLLHYEYRSPMPWWVFAGAGAGAIAITILTVSWQSIKAAMTNPVKSLKTE